ncbi:MAG TPA: hypothetical protein PLK38_09865, partial [Methanoregulaceae archaeon]|nr:hypothetical protein [Methanoregulaceae archaeon]
MKTHPSYLSSRSSGICKNGAGMLRSSMAMEYDDLVEDNMNLIKAFDPDRALLLFRTVLIETEE